AAHQTHHAYLLNEGRAQVVVFNFFGINVFARAGYNDLFLSPGDKQIAPRIQVPEVAGVEPTIADRLSRGIWAVVITLHHNAAPDNDLANRKRRTFRGLRVHNLDLDAVKRLAYGTHHVGFRRSDESAATHLCQAVSLEHVKTQVLEIVS